MATTNTLVNKIACGAAGSLGTGVKGCLRVFREARKFLVTSHGYVLPNVEYNDEYLKTLSAKGDVAVFDGVSSIEPDKIDNSYEDVGRNVQVFDNEGLYGFKIMFIKGLYWQTVLDSYSGYGSYDIWAIDSTGRLMGTYASDGESIKGFTLGIHQAELMEGIWDKNTPRQVFKIQLLNTYEMNNAAIIDVTDDFNGLNVVPVNQVTLKYVSTPSDTDTIISIDATRTQDNKPFVGAALEQFNIKVDGATVTPSAMTETDGRYVFTVAALATGEVVATSLYNNADSVAGISVDGDLYKSKTITTTVVA